MSPLERARQALQNAGLSVYRPGEAAGPCKAAYLVVYDAGWTPLQKGQALRAVGVAAFAPLGQQQVLAPMLSAASGALRARGLAPRGAAGPEGIDEGFRAHTQSLEFTALCAM
jgi:hypothetical protein